MDFTQNESHIWNTKHPRGITRSFKGIASYYQIITSCASQTDLSDRDILNPKGFKKGQFGSKLGHLPIFTRFTTRSDSAFTPIYRPHIPYHNFICSFTAIYLPFLSDNLVRENFLKIFGGYFFRKFFGSGYVTE